MQRQGTRPPTQFCDEHYWRKDAHPCQAHLPARPAPPAGSKPQYFCAQCNCKLFVVNHYFCEKCHLLLCLKHRLPEEHGCGRKTEGCCLI